MLKRFFAALANLTRAANDFAATLDEGNAVVRQGLTLDDARAELRMLEGMGADAAPAPLPDSEDADEEPTPSANGHARPKVGRRR